MRNNITYKYMCIFFLVKRILKYRLNFLDEP